MIRYTAFGETPSFGGYNMPFVAMAQAVAGSIASASEYNKVVANVNQLNTTRTTYKRSLCNADTTVTTSAADLPGTTISFNTAEANTTVLFTAVFDVSATSASDIFIGTLVVDGGSAQQSEAHFASNGRATVTQKWTVSLAAAGSHSAKLRVQKNNNVGTMTAFALHSVIVVEGQGVT